MRCKLPKKEMTKHKKGLWSPDEDRKLTHYIMNHGHGCWSSVPINADMQRNGKSCRLRWINYLRPGLKRGTFSSQEEEETILTLHGLLGNKWSQISQHMPGRTDNEIKNYWHSHLKEKVDKSKHLQVHLTLDNYTPLKMASKEPSSSCLKTSNFTDNSFVDDMVPPVSQISNLLKLLFADWIGLDESQQDFGTSSDQPLSHGSSDQLSTIEHEWQHYKGSTYWNCLDMGSNQMTIDQIFEFSDGDFNIDSFMYL